ncbi:MAG: hypothetical protein ACRC67_22690 [Inquilinus sp.]|uniref:hypothetical protein n=1 Tax=Inquilinus sp. TaxID=1932117 RepID=UPI003F3C1F9B
MYDGSGYQVADSTSFQNSSGELRSVGFFERRAQEREDRENRRDDGPRYKTRYSAAGNDSPMMFQIGNLSDVAERLIIGCTTAENRPFTMFQYVEGDETIQDNMPYKGKMTIEDRNFEADAINIAKGMSTIIIEKIRTIDLANALKEGKSITFSRHNGQIQSYQHFHPPQSYYDFYSACIDTDRSGSN